MACSRRPVVWAIFVLSAASAALAGGRVPPLSTAPDETPWSFHLLVDLGAGAFLGRGVPVPLAASLRVSPSLAVLDDRLRLGATGAISFCDPGLEALVGPRVSVDVRRLRAGDAGELARLQIGAEALRGKSHAQLLGAFARLELPEVVGFTAYLGRETERRDWRVELAIGAVFVRAHHEAPRARATEALASVYQSVWLKSRTKLMAAAAADPKMAERLAPCLRRFAHRAPAGEAALVRALQDAGLEVLAEGDLGLSDTRRSAWAEFPEEALDDHLFVLTVLDAWRNVLDIAR
jgi:hypothetical protein